MYGKITDEFIVDTLRHYEERTKEHYDQIQKVCNRLKQNKDDVLTSVFYTSLGRNDEIKVQDSEKEWRDISKLYERFMQLSKSQIKDIKTFMENIVEDQESMNLVMEAYETLSGKEKDILRVLYIEEPLREYKVSIRILEKKYFCSDRTVFRNRRKALNHIYENIRRRGKC